MHILGYSHLVYFFSVRLNHQRDTCLGSLGYFRLSEIPFVFSKFTFIRAPWRNGWFQIWSQWCIWRAWNNFSYQTARRPSKITKPTPEAVCRRLWLSGVSSTQGKNRSRTLCQIFFLIWEKTRWKSKQIHFKETKLLDYENMAVKTRGSQRRGWQCEPWEI